MPFGKRGGRVQPPPRHRQRPLNEELPPEETLTISDLPGEARAAILAPLAETPQHWESDDASLSDADKELLKKLLASSEH